MSLSECRDPAGGELPRAASVASGTHCQARARAGMATKCVCAYWQVRSFQWRRCFLTGSPGATRACFREVLKITPAGNYELSC